MAKLKVGDVVRFTFFTPTGDRGWNVADPPLWGEISNFNNRSDFEVIFFYGGNNKRNPASDEKFHIMGFDGDGPNRWVNGGDEWELVKSDEWPDEVCAAYAKWRLLSSVTSESE